MRSHGEGFVYYPRFMAGHAIDKESVWLYTLIQDLRDDPYALETAFLQPQSEMAFARSQLIAPGVSERFGASSPQEQKPAVAKQTDPNINSNKRTVWSIFV